MSCNLRDFKRREGVRNGKSGHDPAPRGFAYIPLEQGKQPGIFVGAALSKWLEHRGQLKHEPAPAATGYRLQDAGNPIGKERKVYASQEAACSKERFPD
eukprot:1156993-Pelagomonas_calceolata.AAC.3